MREEILKRPPLWFSAHFSPRFAQLRLRSFTAGLVCDFTDRNWPVTVRNLFLRTFRIQLLNLRKKDIPTDPGRPKCHKLLRMVRVLLSLGARCMGSYALLVAFLYDQVVCHSVSLDSPTNSTALMEHIHDWGIRLKYSRTMTLYSIYRYWVANLGLLLNLNKPLLVASFVWQQFSNDNNSLMTTIL